MSALAATLLLMSTVYVDRDLEPVYAVHLRRHPLGAEARAAELAEQLEHAAELAQVDLALLAALAWDESAVDHARSSSEGALGALQLLPASRWGRGWLRRCEADGGRHCEAGNALWGAYALRDGFEACGGSAGLALGFYRAGRCIEGPRARHTLELARWVRWRMGGPHSQTAHARVQLRGEHLAGFGLDVVHLELHDVVPLETDREESRPQHQAASTFATASRMSACTVTPRAFATCSSSSQVDLGSRTDLVTVPAAFSPFFGRPRRAYASISRRPSGPRANSTASASTTGGMSRRDALLGPLLRRRSAATEAFLVLRFFMTVRLSCADDSDELLVLVQLDDDDEQAVALGRAAEHREPELPRVVLGAVDGVRVVQDRGGLLEGDAVLSRVRLGLRLVPRELHKERVTLFIAPANSERARGAS